MARPERDSARWKEMRWRPRLSEKLVILLICAMTLVFGVLGAINISLQRHQLEHNTLTSAETLSNVIKRNATYYMLRNEREALYHLINDVAREPGVSRIRIINPQGRISFSSDWKETDTFVDKRAEACYGCHSQSQPLSRLNRPDRFRIYHLAGGERSLGIINPIENSASCSNAECHYHPASQEILGVLDTNLSLAGADADMAQSTRQIMLSTALAVLAISSLSGLFVWHFVRAPLAELRAGTERVGSGDLGYQLEVHSEDELADVARSFNAMSRQLCEAREEIDTWTKTLEMRVEEKSAQLNAAHEQMVRVEKMASIGKLAAVVAHEVNNPLAGILMYAKLLTKRMSRENPAHKETLEMLEIIESESRRCGEIVKNLLSFARTKPLAQEFVDLNTIIERCIKLVQHKLTLVNIETHLDLQEDLPYIRSDGNQITQVVLTLVMNAVEAMPRGGALSLKTRVEKDGSGVQIEVRDNGTGMPPEVLANVFEPFFTTKEGGHSLGLGLAISHTIVERHRGDIAVESQPGQGTKFTIRLPLASPPVDAAAGNAATEGVIHSVQQS